MIVSFKSSLPTIKFQNISLLPILDNIKNGLYIKKIEYLRSLKTKKEQDDYKTTLPCFYLSGTFEKSTSNSTFISESYTKLIQIDIDKKDNLNVNLSSLRNDFCKLPFVLACFTSPRGEGLKVIVKHNLEYENHLDAFQYFERYFKIAYNIVIDTQCKNISRAFFVSYDSALYLNTNCTAYEISLETIKEASSQIIEHKNPKFTNVYDFCVYCVEKTCVFNQGTKSKFRLLLAKYLSVYNVCDADIENYILQNYRSSTGDVKTLYDIKSGLKYAQNQPKKEFIVQSTQTAKKVQKNAQNKPNNQSLDNAKELTNLEKIILYIQNNHDLKFNEITKNLILDGKEIDEKELKSLFVDIKLAIPKATEKDFMNYVLSSKIEYVNTIKDFFEVLDISNTTNEIKQVFDCIEFESEALREKTYVFFKKWCIGIVSQILGENNKNLLMPILIGSGFNYKSAFFEQLLPKELSSLFCSTSLDNGKDSEALMCENLLVLIDDMKPANSKESANLRSFLSKDKYTYREPYAVRNTTNKRLASACGTSNYKDVLVEAHLNRRIIPIKLKTINIEKYNSIDKTKFIACCYKEYLDSNGEREAWELTKEEAKELSVLSSEFEQDNSELGIIKLYFTPAERNDTNAMFMQTSQIYAHITSLQNYKDLTARKVGLLLNEENSGFKRVAIKIDGSVRYGFYVKQAE